MNYLHVAIYRGLKLHLFLLRFSVECTLLYELPFFCCYLVTRRDMIGVNSCFLPELSSSFLELNCSLLCVISTALMILENYRTWGWNIYRPHWFYFMFLYILIIHSMSFLAVSFVLKLLYAWSLKSYGWCAVKDISSEVAVTVWPQELPYYYFVNKQNTLSSSPILCLYPYSLVCQWL